jgi:ABC-type xylose transport system permease subunit
MTDTEKTMDPNLTVSATPAEPSKVNSALRSVTRNLQSYVLVIALLVIWIGFGLAAPGYASTDHVRNLFVQMAIIAIMATGMVFVIVTGGIDLSVGYGSGFVSVVAAWMLYSGHGDQWINRLLPHLSASGHALATTIVVVTLALLMAVLMGAFQGFVISRMGVPPFIATLGGFSIFKSGILAVTLGKSLFITSFETYKFIAQGSIPPIGGWVIAGLVTIALFVRVFTTRARKRKYGGALGSLTLQLLRAGVFSVLVIAYVLVVNRTFEAKPQAETAAAESSDAGTLDLGKLDLDESKTEGALQNSAGGETEKSKVGTSTPNPPKIESVPEENANAAATAGGFTGLPTGVPVLVLILGVVALLMSYISQNTRFGRYAYAYGGNREAARLSGIDTRNLIFKVYVLMGLLMGVSGVALTGYVGSGTTGAGQGYELDVIASCILGGTSTLGGEGTVFGAIVGALIIQSLSNGMQMMNLQPYWQYGIKGLVLILAVYADMQFKKKRG